MRIHASAARPSGGSINTAMSAPRNMAGPEQSNESDDYGRHCNDSSSQSSRKHGNTARILIALLERHPIVPIGQKVALKALQKELPEPAKAAKIA